VPRSRHGSLLLPPHGAGPRRLLGRRPNLRHVYRRPEHGDSRAAARCAGSTTAARSRCRSFGRRRPVCSTFRFPLRVTQSVSAERSPGGPSTRKRALSHAAGEARFHDLGADDLAAAALSSPRIIARVRGKDLHYGCAIPFDLRCGCAIPFVAVAAGTGPVAVPSLDEEKAAVFDWDRELQVSERALRALDFMRKAGEVRPLRSAPLACGAKLALWSVPSE
jgi:hypothetical protein